VQAEPLEQEMRSGWAADILRHVECVAEGVERTEMLRVVERETGDSRGRAQRPESVRIAYRFAA
jgi:hypothetical protein